MVTAKESETTLRAKALFEEGEKQYSLSRYEDALAAYEQAFLAKPLPGFLFNVGQCDRMLGKHKEAVRAYERFLEAAPNTPNREEVDKLIASEQQASQEERKTLPPIGTVSPEKPVVPPPAPRVELTPAPVVIAPLLTVPAKAEEAPPGPVYKKWWLWAAVGGAVVVCAGVGIGVAYAVPNNATVPANSAVTIPITF